MADNTSSPAETPQTLGLRLVALAGKRRQDPALLETARDLLAKGADLTLVNGTGDTVLSLAIFNGHRQLALDILEKMPAHMLIHDRAAAGYTAAYLAATQGFDDVLEPLLQKGVSPNHTSSDGYSLLMAAAMNGQTMTVTLLLRHGASRTQTQPDNGLSAEGLARLFRHTRLADFIHDFNPLNWPMVQAKPLQLKRPPYTPPGPR